MKLLRLFADDPTSRGKTTLEDAIEPVQGHAEQKQERKEKDQIDPGVDQDHKVRIVRFN